MKRILKEQVDAMNAFENFCSENSEIWSSTTAFGIALTALRLKINSIYSTESRQEQNNKGVTHTKAEKKAELANSTVAVSNAMQAYALSINDQVLFNQMGVTYSKIYYLKNETAISAAELVLEKVQSFPAEELEPFGITDAVKDTLASVIENYKSVASSTRNVIVERMVLTSNLDKLVKEGNVIMRKNLLKQGRQFKAAYPDFYAGMVANAKVINKNTHAKMRLTVRDESTKQPLAGVLIEISETPLQGMTDMQGKCTITNVGEGKHEVVLKKTNYAVYTIEDVDFKRGKAVNVTVFMQSVVTEQPLVPVRQNEEEQI